MKALVIGATGIIGNHVVRALLNENVEVRAFSRGITPSKNLEGLDVELFKGDLNDQERLAQAVTGCSWVFHTAPYYPKHTFNLKRQVHEAMEGMDKVLGVVSQKPIDRFVYTSSLTTIGKPQYYGQLADESCRYEIEKKPPHPYFTIKAMMEDAVIKAATKGLPAVVTNPTGCFGPYELKPYNLCLVPQLINGDVPAAVKRDINAVDVADVGRGHVLAAQKGGIGQRYILGGHNVDSKWVMDEICRRGGVRPPRITIPLSMALWPAWASEYWAYYITKSTPSIPIIGLRFIERGQHLDITKARSELGYEPSALGPCFDRAIEWFRSIGYC